MYRHGDDPADRHTETPVDGHNRALAALRYVVSKLDSRTLARMMRRRGAGSSIEPPRAALRQIVNRHPPVARCVFRTRLYGPLSARPTKSRPFADAWAVATRN